MMGADVLRMIWLGTTCQMLWLLPVWRCWYMWSCIGIFVE